MIYLLRRDSKTRARLRIMGQGGSVPLEERRMTLTAVLRGTRESQNTQSIEVRFRAKLGEEPGVELALV